jgi:hypothetical protein
VLLLHACSFLVGWMGCYLLLSTRQQMGTEDRSDRPPRASRHTALATVPLPALLPATGLARARGSNTLLQSLPELLKAAVAAAAAAPAQEQRPSRTSLASRMRGLCQRLS